MIGGVAGGAADRRGVVLFWGDAFSRSSEAGETSGGPGRSPGGHPRSAESTEMAAIKCWKAACFPTSFWPALFDVPVAAALGHRPRTGLARLAPAVAT